MCGMAVGESVSMSAFDGFTLSNTDNFVFFSMSRLRWKFMKSLSHFTAYMAFLLLLFIMLYLLSVLQSGVLVYSGVVFLDRKKQEV